MSQKGVLGNIYDLSQERKHAQTLLETGELTKEQFEDWFADWQIRCERARMGTETEVENAKPDMVNHPPHYANRKYEVIDVMEDMMTRERFIGYLEGCVNKYMHRWDKKGKPLQDLEKAQWYLAKLIKTIKEEQV